MRTNGDFQYVTALVNRYHSNQERFKKICFIVAVVVVVGWGFSSLEISALASYVGFDFFLIVLLFIIIYFFLFIYFFIYLFIYLFLFVFCLLLLFFVIYLYIYFFIYLFIFFFFGGGGLESRRFLFHLYNICSGRFSANS